MNETQKLELNWLRDLYLEDLAKMVNYGGHDRPRVRRIGKWAALEAQIQLNEHHDNYVTIPTLDGRKVWVWSDLHFFHKNIIGFSERPYPDVATMNEHLVANFNDYVGPDDISIWVGDVGFGSTTEINALLDQCNGYKILIVGNHDFDKKMRVRKFNFDETHLIYSIDTPEVSMVFTHYPMDNIIHPWVNMHGHLHAFPKLDTGHPLHYNVNCEGSGYRPTELPELIEIAKRRLDNYGS